MSIVQQQDTTVSEEAAEERASRFSTPSQGPPTPPPEKEGGGVTVELEDETQTLTPEEWKRLEQQMRDLGVLGEDDHYDEDEISDEAWRFIARQNCLPLQAVNWAFRQPNLTGSTMLLFAAYVGNMRICGTTKGTDGAMAELLGWSERTVRDHRQKLISLGYLQPGAAPSTWKPRLPQDADFEMRGEPIGIPEDYRDDEIRRRLQQVPESDGGKTRGGVTGACMWLVALTYRNGGRRGGMCVGRRRLAHHLGIDKTRVSHTRAALVEEGWFEEQGRWFIPVERPPEHMRADHGPGGTGKERTPTGKERTRSTGS